MTDTPRRTDQWLADVKCRVYRYAYRVAAAMRLPTEPIYVAYVKAVRRSNAIYWRRSFEVVRKDSDA